MTLETSLTCWENGWLCSNLAGDQALVNGDFLRSAAPPVPSYAGEGFSLSLGQDWD